MNATSGRRESTDKGNFTEAVTFSRGTQPTSGVSQGEGIINLTLLSLSSAAGVLQKQTDSPKKERTREPLQSPKQAILLGQIKW